MPFWRPFFLSAAIMTIAAAGCVAVSDALAPTSVSLTTGTPGGVYQPVGNAICRMFNLETEHQAIPCVAVSSDGSVANIRRVESGESAFGLSQTDVAYAAFHGEGPFAAAGPDQKLRMIVALYPEAFTVVARADTGIRDFQDLRAKRVGIGTSGVGYNFTHCRARLVRVAGQRIDRLLATRPYYIASIIPGGMYVGNPGDVPTIGTRAVLVASSDQPDDLVYAMVKAVFDNITVLRQLHPALSTLQMREMVPSTSVLPIHPGALNYYRDTGLIHS